MLLVLINIICAVFVISLMLGGTVILFKILLNKNEHPVIRIFIALFFVVNGLALLGLFLEKGF